jgi:hypothetical protein
MEKRKDEVSRQFDLAKVAVTTFQQASLDTGD